MLAWNGSWNGAPENPSAVSAVSAMARDVGAANAYAERAHLGRARARPVVRVRGAGGARVSITGVAC